MDTESTSTGGHADAAGFCFRAQLFGGAGDGLRVDLQRLASTVVVYRNGGRPFGLDEDASVPDSAVTLGVYELVAPIGPETPTYVPAVRKPQRSLL